MAKKSEPSIDRVKATKEYREIMTNVSSNIDLMSANLAKIDGRDKDDAINTISSLMIQNFKKADDLVALAKENVATLMTKKQLSDHIAAKVAAESDEVDPKMLMVTDQDLKLFKAINEGIKTINSVKDKVVTHHVQNLDDKGVFKIEEGVYEWDDN